MPIHQIARQFREKFSMQLVSAEGGSRSRTVIAFNVSFEDRNPRVAQQVANELVSLYLNENLRSRREKAAETTGFLAEEASRLGKQVGELEARMADFKQRNSGQLPEQLGLNLSGLGRVQSQLSVTERRLQTLEDRKSVLQTQLAHLDPLGTRVVDGQTVLSPLERLKALQTRLISMRGIYGPEHPDVAKMEREVEFLKKETGGSTSTESLKRQLQELNDQISIERKRYGDKHPDVVKLERQAASLRSAIKAAGSGKTKSKEYAPEPDNPNYLMVQSQIRTIDSEMDLIKKEREELKTSLAGYEERILKIPENEREYLTLRRDYENASAKYRDVRAKQLEAQLAEALETEPNRMAIIFIGLVFAGAAGVGNVFLAEALDESIYGSKGLASAVGQPPMVVVPVIDGRQTGTKKPLRVWMLAGIGVAVVCIVAAIFAYHHFVNPLDVWWFSTLRKFGLG